MGEAGQTGTTYTPVIAIFATAFLMALGIVFAHAGTIGSLSTVPVAYSAERERLFWCIVNT